VQVKRVGLKVGRGDHSNPFVEQRFEQTLHQHRIGNVGDMKLIQTKQPCILGDIA
jgi:hypothetical protein